MTCLLQKERGVFTLGKVMEMCWGQSRSEAIGGVLRATADKGQDVSRADDNCAAEWPREALSAAYRGGERLTVGQQSAGTAARVSTSHSHMHSWAGYNIHTIDDGYPLRQRFRNALSLNQI